jgi:hypothetical protein
LTLSSAQNAFGLTELAHDDGTAETGTSSFTGSLLGLELSLPTGWSAANLLTAKYYIFDNNLATFTVHIFTVAQESLSFVVTPPWIWEKYNCRT